MPTYNVQPAVLSILISRCTMAPAVPKDALAHLQAALAEQGLDIFQPFAVQSYNETLKNKPVPQLPEFGHTSTAAICVGNSKALWPAFVLFLSQHSEYLTNQHPLDAYVQHSVGKALQAALGQPSGTEVLASSVRYSSGTGESFVDMLAAARVSGMAFQDTDIHLCLSPRYGPWLALRAVIVLDLEAVSSLHAEPITSHPFPEQREACKALMISIMADGGWAESNWGKFVQLRRMAAPESVLEEYGYPQAQIDYHYTKSREVLTKEVGKHANSVL